MKGITLIDMGRDLAKLSGKRVPDSVIYRIMVDFRKLTPAPVLDMVKVEGAVGRGGMGFNSMCPDRTRFQEFVKQNIEDYKEKPPRKSKTKAAIAELVQVDREPTVSVSLIDNMSKLKQIINNLRELNYEVDCSVRAPAKDL